LIELQWEELIKESEFNLVLLIFIATDSPLTKYRHIIPQDRLRSRFKYEQWLCCRIWMLKYIIWLRFKLFCDHLFISHTETVYSSMFFGISWFAIVVNSVYVDMSVDSICLVMIISSVDSFMSILLVDVLDLFALSHRPSILYFFLILVLLVYWVFI